MSLNEFLAAPHPTLPEFKVCLTSRPSFWVLSLFEPVKVIDLISERLDELKLHQFDLG